MGGGRLWRCSIAYDPVITSGGGGKVVAIGPNSGEFGTRGEVIGDSHQLHRAHAMASPSKTLGHEDGAVHSGKRA